jgi:FKBP-type peptidyl-prolyl cis-trans isomerase FklB
MKYLQSFFFVLLAICLVNCQDKPREFKKSDLKTQKDKVSYSIGLDMGKSLSEKSVDVDPQIIAEGIKDGMSKSESEFLMTKDEIRETMLALQQEMIQKQEAKNKIEAEKNKAEGDKFLAENKEKPGVKTLPSGLQYKIIKQGTGKKPTASSTVTTHYTGRLINGTIFDSSFKRGQPATFELNQVIKGWTEGLQLMNEGSKWEFYIPSELAYGESGARGVIGPNATLIFEVELLSVDK